MIGRLCLSSAMLAALLALPMSPAAAGRATRIANTLDFCGVTSSVAGNNSMEVPIASFPLIDDTLICSPEFVDFSRPSPIPINLFGTTYDRLFINENGNVSFGAASAATDGSNFLDSGIPMIAGFLADADVDLSRPGSESSIRYGWGDGTFVITYDPIAGAAGLSGDNIFQIRLIDRSDVTGTVGDFDLELNFDVISWDGGGATVGFTDGAGQGFVFRGSEIAGAFLGFSEDLLTEAFCPTPTSLPCSNFNVPPGTINDAGFPVTGRYVFQFRNGTPLAVPGDVDVPEPEAFGLFGLGAAASVVVGRRAQNRLGPRRHCQSTPFLRFSGQWIR